MLNKTPNQDKLDRKSNPCIFIGYSSESKAYRLWNPETRKVLKSRDVKFLERIYQAEVAAQKSDSIIFESFFEDSETTKEEHEMIDPEGVNVEVSIRNISPTDIQDDTFSSINQPEDGTRESSVEVSMLDSSSF